MLIAVVEKLDNTYVTKAFDLAFKWINARGVDPARIKIIKRNTFVSKVLIRTDLIFLIRTIVIKHTDLHRYYCPVGLMLADHIYVLVSVCTHNIPIRTLPVPAL